MRRPRGHRGKKACILKSIKNVSWSHDLAFGDDAAKVQDGWRWTSGLSLPSALVSSHDPPMDSTCRVLQCSTSSTTNDQMTTSTGPKHSKSERCSSHSRPVAANLALPSRHSRTKKMVERALYSVCL
ncbi:hypothetical protein JG688_00008524 [Phytophthora aleatoria]|uniref:Uncharacterized protein n=1 Tax=Phytophthora aleatoria TaxID=2496075 RepID=A0A8J5MFP0_9STRA|nr:hypothetical protein JG688_00008524 [Phytophthora aleatoria]